MHELYATDSEYVSIKFYTIRSVAVFWPSNVQKLTIKIWKNQCTIQLTRMMNLMPSDITAVNSTLSACAMIPNQQNFTKHDE